MTSLTAWSAEDLKPNCFFEILFEGIIGRLFDFGQEIVAVDGFDEIKPAYVNICQNLTKLFSFDEKTIS